MLTPSQEFLFSDLNLTRNPVTMSIDFDWERFTQATTASGVQPIIMAEGRDPDAYVPMLMTLYRYALAAGQPIDLAAEAINNDFDPYGLKEQAFRDAARRSQVVLANTLQGNKRIRIVIPEGVRFAHLALRAGIDGTPEFNNTILHQIMVDSQVIREAFSADAIDIYSFLTEWYLLARLAGEPEDAFMASVRDGVSSTLLICGITPNQKARLAPAGLFFLAPIGYGGEDVSVRVPAEVRWSDLELSDDGRCSWAPLHQILSVSGIDAEVLSGSYSAGLMGRVDINAAINALLRGWLSEAARVGVPIDASLPEWPGVERA